MASKKSVQRSVSKSKVGGKRPEALLDESLVVAAPAQSFKAPRADLKKPLADEQQQAEVLASAEAADAVVVDLSDVVPLVADAALAPVPAATSLESLLVQVATGDTKGGNDSGISPWWLVAGGAGIAALVAGGGSSSSSKPDPVAPLPPAPQGFVVDGFVKNIAVFRDTDRDGKWFDKNNNGKYDAADGDEFITVTGAGGEFDKLGGEGGLIVAASLRSLQSVYVSEDIRMVRQFTTDDVIIGSNDEEITGEAIDLGTNQPFTGFFVANDVKLAGSAGASVYVSAISTLVAQMLAGVPSPTAADLLAAAQKVAVLLNVPFAGTFDAADAIDLFTGEQNTQLASVLASVAASARAVDLGITDQQAVQGFLGKLGEAAVAGGLNSEGRLSPLDLTRQSDLALVFSELLQDIVDPAAAGVLADTLAQSAAGAPAAAQQSVYAIAPFAEDDFEEFISNDVTVGNLSVLAAGDDSAISVSTSVDIAVTFVDGSDLRVEAAGASADASLSLGNVSGLVGNITSQASGSQSSVELNADVGNVSGDLTVSASGESASNDTSVFVSGDLDGDVTVDAGGVDSTAYLNLYVSGDLSGNLGVTAEGGSAIGSTEICADIGADAYAQIYVNGDLIGDVDVTAEGASADASLNLFVGDSADGNFSVQASGDNADAHLNVNVNGAMNGNITIEATGESADASLNANIDGSSSGDVFAAVAVVTADSGDLVVLTGDVSVTAIGQNSYAYIDLNVDGGVEGNLTAEAQGASADAYLGLDVYGSMSGNITIVASGESAEATVDANVYGSWNKQWIGPIGIAAITADSGDVVAVVAESGDIIMLTGDVSVTASGKNSEASIDLYVGAGVDGNLMVEAKGVDSLASAEIEINGGSTGNLTVQATGASAYAVASVDVDGLLNGDVTVTASQANADATLDLDVYGDLSGNITIEASGESAEATLDANLYGSRNNDWIGPIAGITAISGDVLVGSGDIVVLTGDVSVTASGKNSEASIDLYVDGGVDGNLTVEAKGVDSLASAEIDINGSLTGDVTVKASAADAFASLDLSVGDALSGDLIVEATVGGVAYASADVNGDITGDLVVHAIGEGAVADLSLSFSGNLGGELDVKAEDGGKVYLRNGEGNVVLSQAISGDFAVEALGDGTEVHLALTFASGDVGQVTVSADDGTAVAELRLEVNGQVQGNVVAVSLGEGAEAALALTVNGEPVPQEGILDDAPVSVLEGGSVEGSVTAHALGAASLARAYVATRGDIEGSVTVLAEGAAMGNVNQLPFERDVRVDGSDDFQNVNDIDIDGLPTRVFFRAEELNTSNGMTGSGDNLGFARASISLDVQQDVVGEVRVEAVSDRASARLLGNVVGDLRAGLAAEAGADRSAVLVDLNVSGDVGVVGDTNVAVHVSADGEGSTAALSLDVGDNITGNIEIDVLGDGALAVAVVGVNGDIQGSIEISVSADHASAHVSVDIGGDLQGSIDIQVSGQQSLLSTFVSFADETQTLGSSVDLTVEEATSSGRFVIEQATQDGRVNLFGQGRFEVGMVGGSVLDAISIDFNDGLAGVVDVVVSENTFNVSADLITDVYGFNTERDIVRAMVDGFGGQVPDIEVINNGSSSDSSASSLLNLTVFSSDHDASFSYVEVSGDTFVVYDSDGDGSADGILRLVGVSADELDRANFLSQQNIDIVGQDSIEESIGGIFNLGGVTQGEISYGDTVNLGRISISNRELPQGSTQGGNRVSFNVELTDGGRIGDVNVVAVDHVERLGRESVSLSIDGSTNNTIQSALRQSNVNVLAQGNADASLELIHVVGGIASLTVGATAANPGIDSTAGEASVELVSAGYSGASFDLGSNDVGLTLGDVRVGALTGVAGGEFSLTAEDSLLILAGDITVQAGGEDTTADVNLSSAVNPFLGGIGGQQAQDQLVQGEVEDVLVQAQDGGTATLALGMFGPFSSSVESLTVSARGDAFAQAEAIVAVQSVGSVRVEAFDNASAHLNLTTAYGDGGLAVDVQVTGGSEEAAFVMNLGDSQEISLSFSDLDRGIEMVGGTYQFTQVDLQGSGSGDVNFSFLDDGDALNTDVGSSNDYLSLDDFLQAADTSLNGELQLFTGRVEGQQYVALDDDGVGISALVAISGLSIFQPELQQQV